MSKKIKIAILTTSVIVVASIITVSSMAYYRYSHREKLDISRFSTVSTFQTNEGKIMKRTGKDLDQGVVTVVNILQKNNYEALAGGCKSNDLFHLDGDFTKQFAKIKVFKDSYNLLDESDSSASLLNSNIPMKEISSVLYGDKIIDANGKKLNIGNISQDDYSKSNYKLDKPNAEYIKLDPNKSLTTDEPGQVILDSNESSVVLSRGKLFLVNTDKLNYYDDVAVYKDGEKTIISKA